MNLETFGSTVVLVVAAVALVYYAQAQFIILSRGYFNPTFIVVMLFSRGEKAKR